MAQSLANLVRAAKPKGVKVLPTITKKKPVVEVVDTAEDEVILGDSDEKESVKKPVSVKRNKRPARTSVIKKVSIKNKKDKRPSKE
jgi:hypothetical protein